MPTRVETNGRQPMVVAAVSRHCGVCPTQKRILDELRNRHPAESVRFLILDVETDAAQLQAFRILTVPTTILIDGAGTVCHVNSGLIGLDAIDHQIQAILKVGPTIQP